MNFETWAVFFLNALLWLYRDHLKPRLLVLNKPQTDIVIGCLSVLVSGLLEVQHLQDLRFKCCFVFSLAVEISARWWPEVLDFECVTAAKCPATNVYDIFMCVLYFCSAS